ncbi:MAG: TetR/AcrR family transcriptional regulator [Hydrogenophilaceae bacterium]|jgi:AcrR family transcriptional regulator|nr:TetR/AcrR family transcriptional regulator [Hydrogenophilaceae bacterium]
MSAATNGRANQKNRTRKDLLAAASRLMAQGRQPSLEEVAEEALVSRATAYRYFPNVEALLVEASLDIAMPDPQAFFREDASADPVARLERVDEAMHDQVLANETALRTMLVHALQQKLNGGAETPSRQNRRTPLIDAALAPARKSFKPASLDMLRKALALVMGTEAMIVFKDVLEIDDEEARRVKRWAIRALVQAALK